MVNAAIERIPVVLLTGFLGSGKTTLLDRALRKPALADTAVLINELGRVALDHRLVRGASETRVLENGCVCCTVRDDLAAALEALFWDRLQRRVPRFWRVVIETTGLADPGPIVTLLAAPGIVGERHVLQRVICTVDAVHASRQLATRPEALRQVALADVIVVTKADLAAAAEVYTLATRLHALNPLATVHASRHGDVPDGLWESAAARQHMQGAPRFVPAVPAGGRAGIGAAPDRHGHVVTFAVRLAPLPRAALLGVMRDMLDRHASHLLRVKGIVQLAGEGGAWVLHAVDRMLHPLVALPLADASGTLVFIVTAAELATTAGIERDVRASLAPFARSDP